MGTAKVISMSVRPLQVSHLCFETGGILGESNAQLGAQVAAFDFSAFYAILGSMPTIPGHPARLLFDFLEIQAATKPFTLVALRAEPGKAALNKVINARANAYYAKYANAPDIIARMNSYYSPLVKDTKPVRLAVLSSLSQSQTDQLSAAYTDDARTGVVKKTLSELNSTLASSGSSHTTGRMDDRSVDLLTPDRTFPEPPEGGTTPAFKVIGDDPVHTEFQMNSSSEDSTSSGSATESQTISNTDYGYRVPRLENLAQYHRAQISLIDEQFAQFMFGQNLPFLSAVFQNELSSIDSDVYRVQIAYLNTILMSPIAGVVTGVYKNPGDAVVAGEPVIRVENIADVLLVANVVYRGPISVGTAVEITTSLFDSSALATTVTGSCVAARGQRDDDQWELIVQVKNLDSGGKPVFPLGYEFDYDDTSVSIN